MMAIATCLLVFGSTLARGQVTLALRGHHDVVTSVAFSADGGMLASGSLDKSVKLWSIKDALPSEADRQRIERLVAELDSDGFDIRERATRELATFGQRAVGAMQLARQSTDSAEVRWRLGRLLARYPRPELRESATLGERHEGHIYSVAFSPDGATLAVSAADLRLWDVANEALLATCTTDGLCYGVAFSGTGRSLASAGGRLVLWNTTTENEQRQFDVPHGMLHAVAFSPNGKLLAGAGGTRGAPAEILLWDFQSGQLVTRLAGHNDQIWSIDFAMRGDLLASASNDATVRLWNVATGRQKSALVGPEAGIRSVAFSPDGQFVAAVSYDTSITFWEVATGQRRAVQVDPAGGVTLAFSPDGEILAVGNRDSTIKLWDVEAILRTAAVRDDEERDASARHDDGLRTAMPGGR